MTKKVLAVSLVLCVVFSAASAIAQPKRQMPQQNQPREFQYGYCDCYGPRGMLNNQPQFDRNNRQPQPQFNRDSRRDFDRRDFGPCGFEFGPRGPHGRFAPDMPKEIRAKLSEIAKLRIDLDDALYSNPVDKEKALEVHGKILKLEQEVESWKFSQRIDRIEASRKQQELNRNFKPSPAPEAPKPEEAEK